MIKYRMNQWLFSVGLLTCLYTNLCAYSSSSIVQNAENQSHPLKNKESTTCGEGARPMRVTIRHIEPNGVGYNQGYTTLEGFFAFTNDSSYLPFLDIRGHLFNNAKPAANAGFGVRYLRSHAFGASTAITIIAKLYISTTTKYRWVSNLWEKSGCKLDGYLPVGKKTSTPYGTSTFSHFQGHSLYISRKQEFAMKGANAEVGAHIDSFKSVPLYFAAGPYYLEGQGKVAWGEKQGSQSISMIM